MDRAPLKLFTANQLKAADASTITEEGILSVTLMERAAGACVNWILGYYPALTPVAVFCGPGNNGGDGLAIARLLHEKGYPVYVFKLESADYSTDFVVNESRLERLGIPVVSMSSFAQPQPLPHGVLLVDALFGTGLSRPAEGLAADCIRYINSLEGTVISIDLPSGLPPDQPAAGEVVKATHTLTFQLPKKAFLFAQNHAYVGQWHVLDIGLSPRFIVAEPSDAFLVTPGFAGTLLKPRNKFAHKGSFGHALLVAGSYGKGGAAVLAVRACLRSGAGLVTAHLPACLYDIMQITAPEAMVSIDEGQRVMTRMPDVHGYAATGIGPGMGTAKETQQVVQNALQALPGTLVLDADALNSLALNPGWLEHLPENSILTPHPKEFDRLAGAAVDDFDRHERQRNFSLKHRVYVVLKGAHTCITTPAGLQYFNNTGNPGMATGGSGDVLTGILTGLLAQGYAPLDAALLGVFLHGRAGDLACTHNGAHGMTAGDLVEYLPAAFMELVPEK